MDYEPIYLFRLLLGIGDGHLQTQRFPHDLGRV